MLAPLVCLLGLTLVGQDGPSVSALDCAPDWWAVEFMMDAWEAEPADAASADSPTPLDDEVQDFPDEPEGEDEEDPGEAMGSKGPPAASTFVVALGFVELDVPSSPSPHWAALPARPKGSPLSLLCRLRF